MPLQNLCGSQVEADYEQLKAQKRRCEIGIMVLEEGRIDLLPTIVEDMLEYAQEMVYDHAVKKEEE